MALAHTRLKRGKSLVWGLEDSSYSRDPGPLATHPYSPTLFRGVQPTLTVHTPDASSIQIMFTMCPFSPFITQNKKKRGRGRHLQSVIGSSPIGGATTPLLRVEVRIQALIPKIRRREGYQSPLLWLMLNNHAGIWAQVFNSFNSGSQ